MKSFLILATVLVTSHVDAQDRVALNDNRAPAGVRRGRVERSSGITGESHTEADAFERRTLRIDEVVAELERSLRLMSDAFAAIPDAGFDSTTVYARQPVLVRTAWVRSTTHLHEHLGQLIAYTRANGLVPPWSR